ncbi:hypothetical protein G6O67_005343 [Ophiocordyceps sinensis]|uniref:F-box domain-containing protein n=2 Tax=Ophiocordyceps sinensis TaxID=72228 RepID=A0A8H4PRE3_9HYPO|nr:F-box domain protein [Ophiocordyceps sinensis CO18]KAF4509033.1 hypothetical protein G6O67_005343 [Ophiocordyceps sinensis]
MESLPTEILQHISRYLCFHCLRPGVFPNADSHLVCLDKRSLSRLCRTSRRMCAIAQPILYHYYATGNLPVEAGFGLQHTVGGISEDDKLPLFLRTLLQRPDLAAHIRALQLVQCQILKWYPDDLARALGIKMRQLDIMPPKNGASLQLRSCDAHAPDVDIIASLRRHAWLEQLAVALSPGLEMLLVAQTNGSQFFRHAKQLVIPRLRTLAIRGYSGQYYFSGAISLITTAPCLETLYLLDCFYYTGWSGVFDAPLQSILANLRRLVVSDLRAQHLERLLGSCSQLQDLEYYQRRGASIWNVGQVVQSLMPAKDTLRRLYFACLPTASIWFDQRNHLEPGEAFHISRGPAHGYEDALTVSYDTSAIELLSEFAQLEELGLDQASIYSPINNDPETNPGRLARLLPPRLQRLRVMYVYRGMAGDLCRLGREAAVSSPELTHVRLGEAIFVMPGREAGVAQMRRVKSIRTATGRAISVSWTTDRPGADARTRIPGGTVHPHFVPCPVD